ncbi:hypothetical protein CH278_24645 [Rhodococcus sp. 05-2254-5]|uniref:hypothetical protein n=1 Tax=unclassified Rhodococcus (in: high G+C Gram-positive bacteria) TaxID=192944 RepID=UPI000B9A792E|nr:MULTISPECIES: hypothetical protein [unclassified Rhodococcus (in: high G+C Gram-positive bacteria)]OZE28113.1 hypothetical protein CH278_24645 [Rhodococcus sp. 05-2254-5]OZE52476.1 hypothetical protein CH269_23560 [Rhodococcus sp. 05-2254-1]
MLEFTRYLEQRPDNDALAAEWNRTAAEIAAYRDRYQVTDTTSIAGDRPENRAEHAPYKTVHTSIDTLHEHIEQQRRDEHEEQQQLRREAENIEHHHTIAQQNIEHGHQRRGPRP